MRARSMETLLRPGWYCRWRKQSYRILVFDLDTLSVQMERLADSEMVTFRLDDLLTVDHPPVFAPTLPAMDVQFVQDRSPVIADNLPESWLAQADRIITVVETVEALVTEEAGRAQGWGAPFRRTAAIQRAVSQLAHPVALSTFYKYRQRYDRCHGSRTQLAAELRRSTFNQTKMDKAQLHFVDTLVLRYYARQRPLRPATLYRLARSVLERTDNHWINPAVCGQEAPENLVEELLDHRIPMPVILDNPEKRVLLTRITLPSQGWFYPYLRWFEAQPNQGRAVVTARYGEERWDRQYRVFDTFVTQATLPLQYVFADHWLLDVFTVDEATRRECNRLWLTALIDAYSRCVLGIALLYEAPGILSIQQALQHAIWPKTSHRGLDVAGEWVCFGIPQQLSLDNAWAHHSHSLEDLARHISQGGRYSSIDLVFRPPYLGRYGALIERFFGNLSAQVKEHLPGAIQSSQPKHQRQAAQQACLLYGDLNRFLHQLILTYQHPPHSELGGMTPHERWLEGMQSGVPLVPPATPGTIRLFWRMHPDTRVMTRKGISAFGMHYWSVQWGGVERMGRDGRPIQYRLRYDPTDISRIALFREGQWIGDGEAKELRQPDGSVRSLSLAERQLGKQVARAAGVPPVNWLSFVQELDRLGEQRLREKRQAQGERQRSGAVTTSRLVAHEVSTDGADYTDLLAQFVNKKPTRGEPG
jgi:hypothetical protein